MPTLNWTRAAGLAVAAIALSSSVLQAQEPLPWQRDGGQNGRGDAYRPAEPYPPSNPYRSSDARSGDAYRPPADYGGRADDAYRPPPPRGYQDGGSAGYGSSSAYNNGPPVRDSAGYGEPYAPPRGEPYGRPYERETYRPGTDVPVADQQGSFSQNEILQAGHGFFGSISQGLASVVEYAFQKAGRPNGYILGEDAGGAFVAGLRYGEGTLYTKDAGTHKVYWQGPSVGYDFGGEGSKTMVLVYNLRDPSEIYERFGGVQGSAYLVGGVSIQFQKNGDVTLAPIRSGVGLRLGANVGYLKYTRAPTWNPF
jgi:hypothetical protein